jgi:DNA-binding MarR family transcriptional regulator
MSEKDYFIYNWINFSKFHYRVNRSLDVLLHKQFNLVVNEFFLLVFLNESENKRLRISQLQDKIGITQSALSRLINRLETHAEKPIARFTDQEDKRSVYIELTSHGEQYLSEVIEKVDASLMDSLSDKDRKNIETLLE